MANECIPLYDDGDTISFLASAAVTGKKFVDITGAADATTGVFQAGPPSAGGKAEGVAAYDAPIGAVFPVLRRNTSRVVPVTAAGTIAVGAEVQVDATGAVVTIASGVAVGRAWSAGTSGNDVFIALY